MIGGGQFTNWSKENLLQILKDLDNSPKSKIVSKQALVEEYLYSALSDLNSNLIDSIFSIFSSDEDEDIDTIYCSLVEKLADNYNITYTDKTRVETVEKKIEKTIISTLKKKLSNKEQNALIRQIDSSASGSVNFDTLIKGATDQYSKIFATIAAVSLMGFMGSSVLRIGGRVLSSSAFTVLGAAGWGISALFSAQKMLAPDYDKILVLVLFCNYVKVDLG